MEVITLGYFFQFNVVLLILCMLKPAKRALILNLFCAIGFILLGAAHLYEIDYIDSFSAGTYKYSPTQTSIPLQNAQAWFYMFFGAAFLLYTIFLTLAGGQEEDWSIIQQLSGGVRNGDSRYNTGEA